MEFVREESKALQNVDLAIFFLLLGSFGTAHKKLL